jgi:hypothetical protein
MVIEKATGDNFNDDFSQVGLLHQRQSRTSWFQGDQLKAGVIR